MDEASALSSNVVAWLSEQNFRGWLPILGRVDGAHVEEVEGCTRWTSAVPLPLFNGVLGAPVGADIEGAIDRVLEPFDHRRLPLLWVAAPPADLNRPLAARGFEIDPVPAMAMNLRALPSVVPLDGVTIRPVDDDPQGLSAAANIGFTTNGFPPFAGEACLRALERSPERSAVRTYLAEAGGEPAAASVLLTAAGVAGLYNVGTLPTFRGRGIGRAVSLVALHAGRSDGVETGVLQATAMGAPVYRAIGFQEQCRFMFASRSST